MASLPDSSALLSTIYNGVETTGTATVWAYFSLVAAITAESGRPTDMNARAVSIATEESFTCMRPVVDDFCSVTNCT